MPKEMADSEKLIEAADVNFLVKHYSKQLGVTEVWRIYLIIDFFICSGY
jgi:hypothetical protein